MTEPRVTLPDASGLAKAAGRIAGVIEGLLDEAAGELAEDTAGKIRSRARGAGRLASRVGSAVSARGPRIEVSGQVLGVPVTDLFFGANWGGQGRPTTQQFRPYRADDYFFFSTIRDDSQRMGESWESVLEQAGKDWEG